MVFIPPIDLSDKSLRPPVIKGPVLTLFTGQQANGDSDPIDMRQYNALFLFVIVTGTNATATLSIGGSEAQWGTYYPLTVNTQAIPNPAAQRRNVVRATVMDVPVPTSWARVSIADIDGTFGAGQGFSVIGFPYVASGGVVEPHDYKQSRTIVASTTVSANGTVEQGSDFYYAGFQNLALILQLDTNSLTGAGTVETYVQTSPDDGTTWDDICRFADIVNGTATGNYIAIIRNRMDANITPRAVNNLAISASTVQDYFGPQIRVQTVATNLSGVGLIVFQMRAVAWGRGG